MGATLEWGVGPTGSLVFASSMVGVDPRDRPRVTCPECDDVVTFKAGERGLVVPHVAHRSGSACAATNPETAEHMNAKLQLARALGLRGTLRLRVRCANGHAVEADWCAPAWQRAVPEFMLPDVGAAGRRPDVVLFGEGDAVVGAVEVLHTHRVDRAKAADLAAGGVPWVEVRAADVLAWDGDAALPVEAGDSETLRDIVRGCSRCPKPTAMSHEEAARHAAFKAWYAEAKKLPLPPLDIVAAHARCHRRDAAAVAAKVCLPGTKTRSALIEEGVPMFGGNVYAARHALRLLARSPRPRPATIWIAGEHDGIDSMNAPPHLWPLGSLLPEALKTEVADLLAATGSIVATATPWGRQRVYVDLAAQYARSHAETGAPRDDQ